jgi:hypothetical protein
MARRSKDKDQYGILAHILVFSICLSIGYFLGIGLTIAMFMFLSEFLGAIGTLLGTILGLAILFTLLFSFTWIGIIRVGIYGLITGVILAVIVNHPLMDLVLGNEAGNTVISIIPCSIVVAIIILIAIYYCITRYKIVRKKDLLVIEDRKGKYKK